MDDHKIASYPPNFGEVKINPKLMEWLRSVDIEKMGGIDAALGEWERKNGKHSYV